MAMRWRIEHKGIASPVVEWRYSKHSAMVLVEEYLAQGARRVIIELTEESPSTSPSSTKPLEASSSVQRSEEEPVSSMESSPQTSPPETSSD